MSEVDTIKETLTTLRVFFSVAMAIMVAIGGGLVSSFRKEVFDLIFWLGFIAEFILMVAVFNTTRMIKSKTIDLKEM